MRINKKYERILFAFFMSVGMSISITFFMIVI